MEFHNGLRRYIQFRAMLSRFHLYKSHQSLYQLLTGISVNWDIWELSRTSDRFWAVILCESNYFFMILFSVGSDMWARMGPGPYITCIHNGSVDRRHDRRPDGWQVMIHVFSFHHASPSYPTWQPHKTTSYPTPFTPEIREVFVVTYKLLAREVFGRFVDTPYLICTL